MNVKSPELSSKLVQTLLPLARSDFATTCMPRPCWSLQDLQAIIILTQLLVFLEKAALRHVRIAH